MTIENRIANTQGNAVAIVRLLEAELSERVVYLHRAYLLVSLARDTKEVMERMQKIGAESDFGDSWHDLGKRLTKARQQFEAIIRGGDCAPMPCRSSRDLR